MKSKLDSVFSEPANTGIEDSLPNKSPSKPAQDNHPANPFLFMTQATPEQTNSVEAYIKPEDPESEVLKSDVSFLNFQACMFLQAWQKPLTVKGVIDLADATQRFMKTRRDMLKMPYGAPVSTRKVGAFEVLD